MDLPALHRVRCAMQPVRWEVAHAFEVLYHGLWRPCRPAAPDRLLGSRPTGCESSSGPERPRISRSLDRDTPRSRSSSSSDKLMPFPHPHRNRHPRSIGSPAQAPDHVRDAIHELCRVGDIAGRDVAPHQGHAKPGARPIGASSDSPLPCSCPPPSPDPCQCPCACPGTSSASATRFLSATATVTVTAAVTVTDAVGGPPR